LETGAGTETAEGISAVDWGGSAREEDATGRRIWSAVSGRGRLEIERMLAGWLLPFFFSSFLFVLF